MLPQNRHPYAFVVQSRGYNSSKFHPCLFPAELVQADLGTFPKWARLHALTILRVHVIPRSSAAIPCISVTYKRIKPARQYFLVPWHSQVSSHPPVRGRSPLNSGAFGLPRQLEGSNRLIREQV